MQDTQAASCLHKGTCSSQFGTKQSGNSMPQVPQPILWNWSCGRPGSHQCRSPPPAHTGRNK